MADERNLVDEEDTVKENSAQNRREKKKREKPHSAIIWRL